MVNKGQDMEKLIYRGQELDKRIWMRIKNDTNFKKMFDDCLDDLYQLERLNPEEVKSNATLPCGYEQGFEPKFTFDLCESPTPENK